MKNIFKTLLLAASIATLMLNASCGNNNPGNSGETTEAGVIQSDAEFTTDAEGGWFMTFGEYRFYTNGKEASIAFYEGNSEIITLPSECRGIPVVSVAWSAFAGNKKLKEVALSDSIRVLGVGAFSGCTSLETISFSDSLKKIDINCFSGCTSLKEINITKNVTEIGISAFSKCVSLESFLCDFENESFSAIDGVLYSKDKKTLKIYPIGKLNEEYKVDEATSVIADRAFEGNSHIKKADLQNTLEIGNYAFKDCIELLEIKYKNEMTVAGGAFENTPFEASRDTETQAGS